MLQPVTHSQLRLFFGLLFCLLTLQKPLPRAEARHRPTLCARQKKDVEAHKIPSADQKDAITVVSSATLKKGDIVIVQAGEQIPADGEIIEGAASVDESAITGESAPVIRESGGDRSAVTGGTTVLSDWIVVQVTSDGRKLLG